jgi:hypothetical protein
VLAQCRAALANGDRRGGHSKRAGEPQPRVRRGWLLLDPQWHHIEVATTVPVPGSRLNTTRAVLSRNSDRSIRNAYSSSRHRDAAQSPRWTADTLFRPGMSWQWRVKTSAPAPTMPLTRGIGEAAGKVVPAADVAPYLGVLWKVGADRLVCDAEQVIEQPSCFIACLRSLP